MMTFFGLLTYLGGVEGVAGDAGPTAGAHFSTLAIELPRSITPTIAGLTVGSVVGVVGFIAVMLLVGRGNRRSSRRVRARADQVVFIPPYGTMQRETPLPPPFGLAAHASGAPAFRPSNALSARAFAKMRYGADEATEAPSSHRMVEIEVDIEVEEEEVVQKTAPLPAVTVAPVVVVSAADKSAPHPLGIIKSSSSAMRAAPVADLCFDDSPTEIGETYFDEPPQPRRRTDPPRIRKIAPKGPRFAEPTR
jgi:hypothetical protein